jgi:3-phosphoglycerate kinase
MVKFLTMDDFCFENKNVLVRVDFTWSPRLFNIATAY